MSATIGDVTWLLNTAAGTCCGVHLKERNERCQHCWTSTQTLHFAIMCAAMVR